MFIFVKKCNKTEKSSCDWWMYYLTEHNKWKEFKKKPYATEFQSISCVWRLLDNNVTISFYTCDSVSYISFQSLIWIFLSRKKIQFVRNSADILTAFGKCRGRRWYAYHTTYAFSSCVSEYKSTRFSNTRCNIIFKYEIIFLKTVL